MEHPYPPILFAILIADTSRSIGATVIHEQQFEVGERLRKDAVNAAAQVWCGVIDAAL